MNSHANTPVQASGTISIKKSGYKTGQLGKLPLFVEPSHISGGFYSAQYTDPDRYRENERADRDLRAQEEMARWAFWMMVLTGGTVVVTFFGVVLVGFTLRETKRLRSEAEKTTNAAIAAVSSSDRAADATMHAAKAALTANEIQSKALIASQWVHIAVEQDAVATAPLEWIDDAVSLRFMITVKNAGTGTAIDVVARCGHIKIEERAGN